MVRSENPAFIRLSDGTVLGKPKAGVAPPPPVSRPPPRRATGGGGAGRRDRGTVGRPGGAVRTTGTRGRSPHRRRRPVPTPRRGARRPVAGRPPGAPAADRPPPAGPPPCRPPVASPASGRGCGSPTPRDGCAGPCCRARRRAVAVRRAGWCSCRASTPGPTPPRPSRAGCARRCCRPTRGTITDRNGVALATTVDAVNITADQTLVTSSPTPRRPRGCSRPFSASRSPALRTRLTGDRPLRVRRQGGLARDLARGPRPRPAGRRRHRGAAGHLRREDQQARLPGRHRRRPTSSASSGADGKGLGGLEYAMDDVLAGTRRRARPSSAAPGAGASPAA